MPAIEPLFGSKLKISRANRHIRDLESLFDSFVNDNPYRLKVNANEDGSFTVTSEFERSLPSETATIIGDTIHNLRSALDHLACDMIRQSGQEPTRYHGFPIYEKKTDFDGGITSKMKGAANKFMDFVKAQRPYRDCGGNAWVHDLSALDNDDKHIVLTPTIGVVKISNARIILPDGGITTLTDVYVRGNGKINLIHITGIQGTPKLETDDKATLSIQLDKGTSFEGIDVVETLRQFSGGISEILNEAVNLFR